MSLQLLIKLLENNWNSITKEDRSRIPQNNTPLLTHAAPPAHITLKIHSFVLEDITDVFMVVIENSIIFNFLEKKHTKYIQNRKWTHTQPAKQIVDVSELLHYNL
jgi:hypothetical protein